MTKTYGIKVTYALAVYRAGLDELGVRGAYDRACKLADLSQADRADLRRAVDEGGREASVIDEASERVQHRGDVAALRKAVSCGVLDIEVAERVIARLERN